MAQRTITKLVDDLDGTDIEDGGGQTVSFSLDGKSYELDLTNENADELRATFDRYIKAARNVGGRQSSPRTRTTAAAPSRSRSKSDVDPKAVRAWAKSNKVQLSERGRIPQSVIDQFKAAGN
ncbi:Lsr2 family protein [Geodermatophilus sp. SYSU D00691]